MLGCFTSIWWTFKFLFHSMMCIWVYKNGQCTVQMTVKKVWFQQLGPHHPSQSHGRAAWPSTLPWQPSMSPAWLCCQHRSAMGVHRIFWGSFSRTWFSGKSTNILLTLWYFVHGYLLWQEKIFLPLIFFFSLVVSPWEVLLNNTTVCLDEL